MRERLHDVENRITKACERSGRQRTDVQLLLASKKVSAERLLSLLPSDHLLLGENTVQELVSKQKTLENTPFRWHFIGHLQTNKVKDLIGRCELIHSVDRLSLAQEISKRAQQKNKPTNVLIEVNTSGELQKSGCATDKVVDLCRAISQMSHIHIKGLMTVPQNSPIEADVRQNFRVLKLLFLELKKQNIPNVEMRELSMGMSNDFEWAIEEGSTMIRIGSLIFGERPSR
jgi:pyridoxal phosphate enzyme (YggS family)